MGRSKLLAIFLAVLMLSGCEDVVQVKLDEGAKLYVIDAFINDLPEQQVIRVTMSDNYFSTSEVPPVNDAQVTITDLSLDKTFDFISAGNGNYVYTPGPDTLARQGHQYQLNVRIGGVLYTALTVQKRPARIDSIVPRPAGSGGFGPPRPGIYRCRLVALDRADNNPDYYWIKTFRNDTSLFNANAINISIDGTNGEVYGVTRDTTKFTEPGVFLGFATFRKADRCRVEIHSLTKENYLWFIQAAGQVNNGGLFATTPENVKSNVVTPEGAKIRANGRFNVASVARKEIIVQ